jgi:hypothetical protein
LQLNYTNVKLIEGLVWRFGLVYGVNATFNNISVVLSRSVLLLEETGIPEKTIELSEVADKLYHIMLYRVHPDMSGFKLTAFVVIDTKLRYRISNELLI